MKVKNSLKRNKLIKAHLHLFIGYAYSAACVCLILFLTLATIEQHPVMVNALFRLLPLLIGASIAVALATVFSIVRNWRKTQQIWHSEKRVRQFRKNLTYLVRSEYGYVTEENVESVRKLAATLYSMSTGDTTYNKMYHQSPAFFNSMILSKAEFFALYRI